MKTVDIGIADYNNALKIQNDLLDKRIKGKIEDTLVLVEHPPVLTLGRLAEDDSVIDRSYFEENGIPIVRAGRGGGVTYHSLGQLVMYPIVDLKERKKDVSRFIDFLERTVLGSLRELGVPARLHDTRRGVWVDDMKIAFIGVAFKRWVSYHGVSVNISNDTEAFSRIDPCGMKGVRVVSAGETTGCSADIDKVKELFARRFMSDLDEEYRGDDLLKVKGVKDGSKVASVL